MNKTFWYAYAFYIVGLGLGTAMTYYHSNVFIGFASGFVIGFIMVAVNPDKS